MLHAYIDESEREEDFYFLGAIVGSKEQIFDMNEALKGVMRKHASSANGLRYTEELHGSTMMRGAVEPWRSIPKRLVIAIYVDALRAIEESGVRVRIEGIDIHKLYAHASGPRELALRYLLERINECAEPGETVQLHADDHHTAEESRSNFAHYQVTGTLGYKSSKLEKLESNILFEDSQYELALQAADLVTYIYNRKRTITEKDQRAEAAKKLMYDTIRPALTSSRGSHRIWPL